MDGEGGGAAGDVTRLLEDYARGDRRSFDRAIAIVYQELKSLARAQLRRSGVRDQVQTTALVHEAFEKLALGDRQDYSNRRHFFAVASRAMRQIVVDTYRRRMSARRGGGAAPVDLVSGDLIDLHDPERLLRVDQAMESLAAHSEDLVEVLDMACFGGLSSEQIAELTGTTARTVQRKLLRARAWIDRLLAAG